ncbi:MAG: ATP-binding protein [Candidatus Zapsychrus exili]|nr:ATP-binding protein [Candidatus Zapsychrus exili]
MVLYSAFLYFSLYRTLYDELDSELNVRVESVLESIYNYADILPQDRYSLVFVMRRVITLKGEHKGQKGNITDYYKKEIVKFEDKWNKKYEKLNLSEYFIHLSDSKGNTIVKSENLFGDLWKVFQRNMAIKKEATDYKVIKFKKKNLRLRQSKFVIGGQQYLVQIAVSQKPIVYLLQNRLYVTILSIPLILILYGFLGHFIVRRILGPVDEIIDTARNITHENLSKRLQYKYIDEEMKNLVEAFNEMIARLQNSFSHITQFSSEVAHELKTPIAIIRGECELALRKVRSPEEYKRVIKTSLEESRRLLKTVEDLLLLSKFDYRPEIFKLEPISGNKFLKEICEQTKILASEKELRLEISFPKCKFNLEADNVHLRRLFFNIIHNAIKFTPVKGKIAIDIVVQKDCVHTSITDNGVGIPEENMPKIFNRFFHKNEFYDPSSPSNGLGLNIALSIAKIHKGDIKVSSTEGKGSIFTITLPATS